MTPVLQLQPSQKMFVNVYLASSLSFLTFFYFQTAIPDNLFINYLSRIHRDEDFQFILSGVTRLLNNPLLQTYLPNSTKKVHFHQELLVFFWKMCDYNKVLFFPFILNFVYFCHFDNKTHSELVLMIFLR